MFSKRVNRITINSFNITMYTLPCDDTILVQINNDTVWSRIF